MDLCAPGVTANPREVSGLVGLYCRLQQLPAIAKKQEKREKRKKEKRISSRQAELRLPI
jgi:hypothetical protein